MKKNNKLRKILLIFPLLLSMILTPKVMLKAESFGDFYVEPQIPENQYNKESGFFDLIMGPGMQQTLSFDIINQGSEPMVASLTFNDGTTDLNAEKSYKLDKEPDTSMQHPMTSMATMDRNSVEVAPGSKETVFLNITAPAQPFDGVSVGGVIVTVDYKDETKKKKSSEGIEINNRISYLLAVQMRMNENPVEKNLNYIRSTAESIDLKPQFVSYIQNDRPVIMNNVTVAGTITSSDGKEVASISKDTGGILPNTEFPVAYEMVDKKIKDGDYKVHLKITSDEGVWEWNEQVTIAPSDADNANKQTLQHKIPWMVYVLIAFLIIIILLMIYVLIRRKKEK